MCLRLQRRCVPLKFGGTVKTPWTYDGDALKSIRGPLSLDIHLTDLSSLAPLTLDFCNEKRSHKRQSYVWESKISCAVASFVSDCAACGSALIASFWLSTV